MSRIGKLPIKIPEGVEIKVEDHHVRVKGSKGELMVAVKPEVNVEVHHGEIVLSRANNLRQTVAYHGLFRSLIANMITGVTKGFQKELEMSGVGYKAKVQGSNKLVLSVGYSRPVEYLIPAGTEVKVNEDTKISIFGIDKKLVGEVAAQIRRIKPCEPYKGKGIKYIDEVIRRKVGKAAKTAGTA